MRLPRLHGRLHGFLPLCHASSPLCHPPLQLCRVPMPRAPLGAGCRDGAQSQSPGGRRPLSAAHVCCRCRPLGPAASPARSPADAAPCRSLAPASAAAWPLPAPQRESAPLPTPSRPASGRCRDFAPQPATLLLAPVGQTLMTPRGHAGVGSGQCAHASHHRMQCPFSNGRLLIRVHVHGE